MEILQGQTRAAKPGRRIVKPFLVGVIAILLISILAALPAAAGTAPERNRPRIGLVLSGGGARGAAHIGVLKVLEELRIPVFPGPEKALRALAALYRLSRYR